MCIFDLLKFGRTNPEIFGSNRPEFFLQVFDVIPYTFTLDYHFQ